MKFLNTRFKKIIFWSLFSIICLVVLVIAFISPLTKWAIEKYDVKYTGREITLDLAYVNPFTGTVYLKNLKIFEPNSDTTILACSGLSVNFEVLKMLSKTYEISSASLDDPEIRVVQNKKHFNFSDIIERFSSKDTVPKKPNKEPTHFNCLNMKINNGTFYYVEQSIPVNYFIKQVNIETNGLRWDADTMGFRFSFLSGPGSGSMKGVLDLNLASLDYRLRVQADKYDLSALGQYVKDVAYYGSVRGNLDADLDARGNFKKAQELNAKGQLAVNEFHFGKNAKEDFLYFKKTAVSIIELSPAQKKYAFDSISVVQPYFKYERYDHLDNLLYMFGQKGEKAQESKNTTGKVNILFKIGGYIEQLAKNFFKSNYKMQRLAVYDADLHYNDFALNEEFAAAVSPLTLVADSIERGDKWVNLQLRAGFKPYGDLALDLSINPRDSSDFVLAYSLKKVSMAQFNPYLVTYTGFPLDRGILEFQGSARVTNGVITCDNHLLVIDPRINNRQKRNGNRWLPMRIFMFLARDRGNVIDYEIPIRGNLRDPKFKLGDVILDVLRNIFVKPVTVPYRTEVRNVENTIEKSLTLKWVMRSATLNPPQEKFIREIVDFLKEDAKRSISIRPELYAQREKEYILFFEAKKKFYMSVNKVKAGSLDERDSSAIERLAIKDSTFIKYLDRKGGKNLHTIQDKCYQVVSHKGINHKLQQLNQQRRNFFMSFFNEEGISKQVHIKAVKDTVPFNGFSLYRVNFEGQLPENVQQAYEKMHELDDYLPRSKFKEERRKDRKLLDAR